MRISDRPARREAGLFPRTAGSLGPLGKGRLDGTGTEPATEGAVGTVECARAGEGDGPVLPLALPLPARQAGMEAGILRAG